LEQLHDELQDEAGQEVCTVSFGEKSVEMLRKTASGWQFVLSVDLPYFKTDIAKKGALAVASAPISNQSFKIRCSV